ncbi:MAG: DUF502 domain-containing protein [Chlamydiales bacterium]
MLKKYFLTGLAVLLPLTLTLAIVGWVVNLLTGPFIGICSSLLLRLHIINRGFLWLTPEETVRLGSQLLILIFLFFFTLGLGIITRSFFINTLLDFGDRLMRKIPIIRTVYKTVQDVVKSLFGSGTKNFKQVVMVPFPHPGVFALGLIAGSAPPDCSAKVGEELISVLLPTTPNPTSGYLLMYKKKDLIFVDMPPEEAIKFIVSCGVIAPSERHT